MNVQLRQVDALADADCRRAPFGVAREQRREPARARAIAPTTCRGDGATAILGAQLDVYGLARRDRRRIGAIVALGPAHRQRVEVTARHTLGDRGLRVIEVCVDELVERGLVAGAD